MDIELFFQCPREIRNLILREYYVDWYSVPHVYKCVCGQVLYETCKCHDLLKIDYETVAKMYVTDPEKESKIVQKCSCGLSPDLDDKHMNRNILHKIIKNYSLPTFPVLLKELLEECCCETVHSKFFLHCYNEIFIYSIGNKNNIPKCTSLKNILKFYAAKHSSIPYESRKRLDLMFRAGLRYYYDDSRTQFPLLIE